MLADNRDRAVVVAVITMRVVQATVHQVIVVVSVRNALVAAVGVITGTINRRAVIRVRVADSDDVFVVVTVVRMVQMAVMQVVDVPVVLYPCMTAVFAVNVVMIRVYLVFHKSSFIYI